MDALGAANTIPPFLYFSVGAVFLTKTFVDGAVGIKVLFYACVMAAGLFGTSVSLYFVYGGDFGNDCANTVYAIGDGGIQFFNTCLFAIVSIYWAEFALAVADDSWVTRHIHSDVPKRVVAFFMFCVFVSYCGSAGMPYLLGASVAQVNLSILVCCVTCNAVLLLWFIIFLRGPWYFLKRYSWCGNGPERAVVNVCLSMIIAVALMDVRLALFIYDKMHRGMASDYCTVIGEPDALAQLGYAMRSAVSTAAIVCALYARAKMDLVSTTSGSAPPTQPLLANTSNIQ